MKGFTSAAALLAYQVQCAIVTDGLWTGHDWYSNEQNIGVQNGEPYSNDAIMNHTL